MDRNCNIEFTRIIAAFMIMSTHQWVLGRSNYAFYDGWIYVEFFLILTGYFTRRHFDNNENKKR